MVLSGFFLRERLQGQFIRAIFRLLLDMVATVEIGRATLLDTAERAHPLQVPQHVGTAGFQNVFRQAGLRQTPIKQSGGVRRFFGK